MSSVLCHLASFSSGFTSHWRLWYHTSLSPCSCNSETAGADTWTMASSSPFKCQHWLLASAEPTSTVLLKGESVMFYNQENFLKRTFNQACLLTFALHTVCGVELGWRWDTSKLGFFVTNSWQRCLQLQLSLQPHAENSVFWTSGYNVHLSVRKARGNIKGIQISIECNCWDTASCWCIYLTKSHVCFLVPLLQAVEYSSCC